MARPKKTVVRPEEAALFDAYKETCEDPLPDRADLLQDIVCALLARIRRDDEQAATRILVFISALAARAAYWKKHRLNPMDRVEEIRERESYAELLREISRGTRIRSLHCRETIRDQGILLDRYLEEHPDFLNHRNASTRMKWIESHAPAINDLLIAHPCFCTYEDKIIEVKCDERGLRDVLVKPRWLNIFAKSTLTTAKLRDAFLAMLHGASIDEIVQIRKKPGSFTVEAPIFGCEDDEWLLFGLTGKPPYAPPSD